MNFMRSRFFCPAILILIILFSGCNDSENGNLEIKADFNDGITGWIGGYADYADGTEPDGLSWEYTDIPAPLSGKGYKLAGKNYSDDLFVYTKKKYSGFKPNTSYDVSFEVVIATDVPGGCVGVGGAPGESVWIFAGASEVEPMTVLEDDGNYRVNFDRGNQSLSGKQAVNLGDISNSVKDCSEWAYQIKTVRSASSLRATSDSNGNIWIMLGMDSGFETDSDVFLVSMEASFLPKP